MSRMQDALFRTHPDECAKPAVPVPEMCKVDTQEQSQESSQDDTLRATDSRQLRRQPILWIVPKPAPNGDRSSRKRTARLKSTRARTRNAPDTRNLPEVGRVSTPCDESVAGDPRQKEDESLAAQVRRFQEQADLRECLLPGMLGKVSRKACEGWQRQAPARNSRMLARIKLDSCKKCKYALEPAPTPLPKGMANTSPT